MTVEASKTPGQILVTKDEVPLVNVVDRLRMAGCPHCGILFALPLEVYLRRAHEKGDIHCPNGHRFGVTSDDDSPEAIALLQLQLIADIRQARHEAEQLRNTLARMPRPPAEPVTGEELERRIKYLVNRARRTDYGRPICRFCESHSSRDSGLKQHLKRDHSTEIAAMSADYFDQR